MSLSLLSIATEAPDPSSKILRHSEVAALEFEKLVRHAVVKPVGFCNAVADQNDRPDLRLLGFIAEMLDFRLYDAADFIRIQIHVL